MVPNDRLTPLELASLHWCQIDSGRTVQIGGGHRGGSLSWRRGRELETRANQALAGVCPRECRTMICDCCVAQVWLAS